MNDVLYTRFSNTTDPSTAYYYIMRMIGVAINNEYRRRQEN